MVPERPSNRLQKLVGEREPLLNSSVKRNSANLQGRNKHECVCFRAFVWVTASLGGGGGFLPLSSVDVLQVPREPIQQQEDVSAACNPVTDPGPLLQQPFLPHQLPTADARVQILGLLLHQVGPSKEVRHACATAATSDWRSSG